jgi:hypothetical protein
MSDIDRQIITCVNCGSVWKPRLEAEIVAELLECPLCGREEPE